MGLGGTRRDDANALASPRVNDNEQSAYRAHAKRDESLFIRIGFVIRDRDGISVVKNRNRFGHPDAVLAVVDSGFARVIPLKAHSFSVRTCCAYVKAI